MISVTPLHPDVTVKHAVGLAALLDLADLCEDILLAQFRLLSPDGAVADILERLDVLEDKFLTRLRVALRISDCQPQL